MLIPHLRFGVWALAHGTFASRQHPEETVDASWRRNRAQVLLAEKLGYDSTLILQHTISPQGDEHGVLEAWSAAAALVEATNRIEVIAAIKPLLYHPAVLSKMALQIEEISEGRFGINFVNAWYKPELERAGIGFPEHDERYGYGGEWLEIATSLLDGKRTTFKGKYFSIDGYMLRPFATHRRRPMIYVSGESEAPRTLAARPRGAGLAPLRFAMPAYIIARPTDREAEEELAYARELFFKDRAGSLNREANTDPKARMLFQTHAAVPQIGIRGGTASGLVGSYDKMAARLRAFSHIGVETLMLQFQPFEREMTRFAEEVIPRVRREERLAG